MSGSVDVGSIEPGDLENVCVDVEIVSLSHSSAEIWLLPVSEPIFFPFPVASRAPGAYPVVPLTRSSSIALLLGLKLCCCSVLNANSTWLRFFPLGKGFPWFSTCSRWNAAMCDTPKNHILDALPISENRMEKFLSVQEIVGGSRSPPRQ